MKTRITVVMIGIALIFIPLVNQKLVVRLLANNLYWQTDHSPFHNGNVSCQASVGSLCGTGAVTVNLTLQNSCQPLPLVAKITIEQQDNLLPTYIFHVSLSPRASDYCLLTEGNPHFLLSRFIERIIFVMVILVLLIKPLIAKKLRWQLHFIRIWWLNRELKRFGRSYAYVHR